MSLFRRCYKNHSGGTPIESGSTAGFMHRAWMDIKSTFSDDNEEAVLEACETGEKAALEDYDEFLNKITIGAETRTVVENQRNHIADTLGKVKRLEDAFDA